MAETGVVYLVGAGPGDPGLLTVKGLRVLKQADVVVYDRLVNPRLLAEAPPGAELIHAHDDSQGSPLTQDQISEILIERARQGKRVVRLKGGDPFLFARGGEEAEALAAGGVRFEVVPGVSSATAVPAYAGIPLTDRRFASSVRIVTGRHGHEAEFERGSTGPRETVVALMGVETLPEIVAGLLDEGWPPDTPVALIERGTTSEQRAIETVLAGAVADARTGGLRPPAIAVFGGVAGLRQNIAWFESMPLSSLRILVLRPATDAAELGAALESQGAETVLAPAIAFETPLSNSGLDDAFGCIGNYRWIAFTSVPAVDFFMRRLGEMGRDTRFLGRQCFAAIGPATARALQSRGIEPDVALERGTSATLNEALVKVIGPGERVLLPQSDLADDALRRGLEQAGVAVEPVVVYRTVAPPELPANAGEALARGVDVVVFTSPSTVHNLVGALKGNRSALDGAAVACIGPVTAEAARSAGLTVAVEAADQTSQGIVDGLVAWRAARGDDSKATPG